MTHKLSNNWTFWFHEINKNNWKLSSYTKIQKFNEIETFLNIIKKIDNFSAGMFFLMKENILPIWEVKENKSGGYWSFKIPKNQINKSWRDICSQVIGNTLLKEENLPIITGVSLSPKINNCIIKIWINKYIDIKEFNIENIETEDSRYFKHNR